MPHRTEAAINALAKLGPSYDLLLQLAYHAPSLVALCNADGELLYLNPAGRKLIGVDQADIFPMRLTDYIVPAQRELVWREIVPTARDHGVWRGRMQLLNASTGATIAVQRATFRIQDDTGNITSFVSAMAEIPAPAAEPAAKPPMSWARPDDEAADPGHSVDQLSHDLKNMIASVLGGFAAIERRSKDPAIAAIALAGKKAAEDGLAMVNRLKDIRG